MARNCRVAYANTPSGANSERPQTNAECEGSGSVEHRVQVKIFWGDIIAADGCT